MDRTIPCPIISKICETNPIYDQKVYTFNNEKIIVTSCLRGNKRCVVYIPGYDDYFYYHHIVEEYPDIDFMSIDIPGFGYNKGYYFDNHLADMGTLCAYISCALEIYESKTPHDRVDILGFSMGGQIALYYVWLSEHTNGLFKFDNLLLSNPLLNFYIDSVLIRYAAVFISRIIYLFSNKINIRPSLLEYETEYLYELEDIFSSEKLKKYGVKNFDVWKVGGNFPKPFSNGTMVTVMNNMCTMINSTGITTRTICIYSSSFGNTQLKQDNVVNPADIESNLPKICKNYKLCKFEMGHSPFRQPFFAEVNYVDICNVLFERK